MQRNAERVYIVLRQEGTLHLGGPEDNDFFCSVLGGLLGPRVTCNLCQQMASVFRSRDIQGLLTQRNHSVRLLSGCRRHLRRLMVSVISAPLQHAVDFESHY